MCFVGREKETKLLHNALKQKHNVIVAGSFGIGKTYLVTHVAENLEETRKFVFVDFSKSVGDACIHLLKEFSTRRHRAGKSIRSLSYKSGRSILSRIEFKKQEAPIIVLDNVFRFTNARKVFLRELSLERRYQFIAITESFLPPKELFLLRATLYPVEMITLRYFNQEATLEYFRSMAQKKKIEMTEERMRWLAKKSRGHPLMMRDMAKGETTERAHGEKYTVDNG